MDCITIRHLHGTLANADIIQVIGEKTTFPPHWLINACHARGWTYATASYHSMPESEGLEVLSDALDAVQWIHKNIGHRIVIAGSSAGGYLALATAAHPECPRPLAVLSVYGMLDPASTRYIEGGTPLLAPVADLPIALEEIDTAVNSGKAIDGYAFPASPPTDQRFTWICALHQAARYPDLLTRTPGLAGQISAQGAGAIPERYRTLFPVSFGLKSDFPPTILLHGDGNVLVGLDQSTSVAERMLSLGADVHLEIAKGQGHGFEAKGVIDIDAKDAAGEDVAINECLRRVITALEKAVGSH